MKYLSSFDIRVRNLVFIVAHREIFPTKKYRAQQPPHPIFLIVSTTSQSSILPFQIVLLFIKAIPLLAEVFSCAPATLSLPPGNPALSFYIPRSDCGLYYCFPLSAPTNIPSLSDFALPYQFLKGLFPPQF